MDEAPNEEFDLAQPPPRTAALLIRIAAILKVDPAFFLRRTNCAEAHESSSPESDLGELLRLFHAIEDADTRRAALNLVRMLQTRDQA